MKAKLVTLLLCLLPLQCSWAAVTLYCLHDLPNAVAHSEHLGHHDAPTCADEADETGSRQHAHSGCDSCQHSVFSTDVLRVSLGGHHLAEALPKPHTPFVLHTCLAPPERPQWSI